MTSLPHGPHAPYSRRVSPFFGRLVATSLVTLAILAPVARAYVGQWHSFSDMNRVLALAVHQGQVYAGTNGGIRRIAPATSAQREFTNLDGLIDPWITGLSGDDAGNLWAVARSGFLYRLDPNRSSWSVEGRSYQSNGWVMNERAVLAIGSYLYLGSQKGLAIYDTRLKVSQLNLTRFGNDIDVPVLSLLRRADTLYVGTTAGVYKAPLHFDDPLNPPLGSAAVNPSDHSQWVKVAFPVDPSRAYNHLAFIGDSLATYGPGTLIQAPSQAELTVRAFTGSPLVIGTQTYPPPWTDYTSAVMTGGKVFVGGLQGLAVSANPTGTAPDAAIIPPLRAFPRDTIANIGAYGNIVWGHSQSGLHRLDPVAKTATYFPSAVSVNPPGVQEELYYRFLRNVTVDPLGDVYVGSWGGGLVRRRANGQNQSWKNTAASPPSCFNPAIPADPFTVIHSLSRPRKGGFFFTVLTSGQTYQLAYFDTAASAPSCPTTGLVLAGGAPHAVHAFSDTLLGVATENGVTFMKVREEATGPRFESIRNWTLPGSTASEAWDLASDGWNRPWALIGNQLAFLDSLDLSTKFEMTPIDNFIGENCKSLESDPSGKLWVGCSNGLFHVTTDPSGSLASVRRYVLDDGLPSLFIYDVSVDPINGRVWVATDRGVALFESSSQPSLPSGELAVVVPYPNPFRPQHAFVIFNKLPANSTLRIHTPTGQIARTFHPQDMQGTEVQWDGRSESGQRVAPGVYLFSVTSGGKVQRGKVIVAR